MGQVMQNGADAASLCGDATGAQRLEDAKNQSQKNRESLDENIPKRNNQLYYWLNTNDNKKDPYNSIRKKPPETH